MEVQKNEGVQKAVELGCNPSDISIFSDEGVSGAILERPRLMAALSLLKQSQEARKYFICYDSSRLSRNAAHQLIIIDEIKKCQARLVFLKNNYEDNAEGRFQLTVMAAVDEYERARLKLRTEMGKRAKAGRHMLTHNPGLYGYNFDPITDKLKINEEQAQNLRFMFELLVKEHRGPSEISETLNASGIPSPRLKLWNRVTVGRILKNPSYMGILYIRRYDTRECSLNKYKKKGEKQKVRERPIDDWIPVEIPKLIENETWHLAQEIMNKKKSVKKSYGREDFLLSNLLRCENCGKEMKGKTVNKNEKKYKYYICSNKYDGLKGQKCLSKLVSADAADEAVWAYFCNRITCFSYDKVHTEKAIEEYLAKNTLYIKDMMESNKKTEAERERVLMIYQKGFIDESEVIKRLDIIEKKIELFSIEMIKAGEHKNRLIEKINKNWRDNNLQVTLDKVMNNLDITEKRYLAGLLIAEVEYKDDILTIRERA
ncbi:MAG: recombinase family protein [Pseudomonadota bacterium]